MNVIKILSPRWHDRTVLVGTWRVGSENQIIIEHPHYPEPLYMLGKDLRTYPIETKQTKQGKDFTVYVVPIDDFITAVEYDGIIEDIKLMDNRGAIR